MHNEKDELKDIKLVIFDMDGTMFDTERLGIEGWEYAFKYFNIPVPHNALINKIGLNSTDSKKVMIDEVGQDFDYKSVKEVKRKYVTDYIKEKGTPIKKGLLQLLSFLDSLKIKKVVATSRSRKMTSIYMAYSNLEKEFDAVITGDLISKGKPNPDIFLLASNMFGFDPSNCLVLEDSINGILAASNAGMKPVMIPDLVKPNTEIEKLLYAKCDTLLDVIEILKCHHKD